MSDWDSLIRSAGERLGSLLDAQILAAHVAGKSRSWLIAHGGDASSGTDALESLVERRAKNEPLPYILGWSEFYGNRIEVTPDVLIPRPETEMIVEAYLGLAPSLPPGPVVDVGTGSGCIMAALIGKDDAKLAVSGAERLSPHRRFIGIDVSLAALAVAHRNVPTASLLHADLLSALRPSSMAAVLSNPPYVADEDPRLDADVAAHEPRVALFGGHDGLRFIQRLILSAQGILLPGGALVMEFGIGQANAVRELLSDWADVKILPDLAGIPRVAVARVPG